MLQGRELQAFHAPDIGRAMRRVPLKALLQLGAALLLAAASTFPAHGFSSAPYFPLADGNQWTYQLNGGPTYSQYVQGTVLFNGVSTKAYYDSEDGSVTYYTNDASGIRAHGAFYPPYDLGGCISSETDVYSPPVVIATPDVTLGQIIPGSGTVAATVPSCGGTFLISYSASSTIVGNETISVPLGTFSVLRVNTTLSLPQVPYSRTVTYWVALNVGVVQSTWTEDGFTGTYKLTATNVVRTAPDTFSFTAQTGVALNSTVTTNTITVTGTTTG